MARVSGGKWKGSWTCSSGAAWERGCVGRCELRAWCGGNSFNLLVPSPESRENRELFVDPVAAGGWLRDNQEPHGLRGRIANLVARARQDSDSAARRYQRLLAIHFHQDLAAENVEELLGVLVMMANLGGARGHELFDHTQVLVSDQVPAIAVDTPAIVFGVLAADGDGRGRF